MEASTFATDRVALTRLDNADPELLAELMDTVAAVAAKAAFTGGAEVDAFEAELAEYCGSAEAVGVSSGTEALVLVLRALGIGAGDEVILPANSFIATAEAVSLVGATPRLVDVDAATQLIDTAAVERSITANTRAVIPVHLYGRTADLAPLVALAESHGLPIVEDACQAHGAFYRGRRAGSIGVAGCFSFYPAKNLGAWGDGGAVVTDDPALAEQLRLLRSHGESPRYHHRIVGTTARLDALQAAILRVKLRRLDEWNERRRGIARHLTEALEGTALETPCAPLEGTDHVFHQYVVRCDARDAFRAHLDERGVATGIHYPIPIHLSEAYAPLGLVSGDLPVAERDAGRICSLPMSPLMEERDVERVAEAARSFDPRAL